MHERYRDAFLQHWGHAVANRPWVTLLICLVLVIVALALTVSRLEFKPDRSELIDQKLDWNRRYAEYKANFRRWDSLLVVFEADPDDERVDTLTREIAARLESSDRVLAADAGFHESQADPRMFILAPPGEFEAILDRLKAGKMLASAEHANEALVWSLNSLSNEVGGPGAIENLRRLLAPYLAALRGEPPRFRLLEGQGPRWRPLASESGRLRFIQVEFTKAVGGIDSTSENLRWLRRQVSDVVESADIQPLAWGVTGITAIEADETVQSIHDSTLSSVIAFLAITALMLIVFRGVWVPLLAAGSLLIGMAWSFGWLVLAVGHLQLLSVVFSVILLGLGVDFALHLVSRLELVQDEHDSLSSAIARVFRGIGPGMLTGAITTAAAFAATAFTDFRGMAEMGVIAAGGILLCLVAMLSAFPAGLAATRRWKDIIRHRPGGEEAHFAHSRLDPLDGHPWTTLSVATLVIVAMLIAAREVRYDPNVLNLHPPGIESVVWEKRLVEEDARSVWSALIETTPDRAEALTRRLRALDTVSDVGGMGVLFPRDLEQRREQIQAVRALPAPGVQVASGMASLRSQLAAVRQGLSSRIEDQSPEIAEEMRSIIDEIDASLRASRAFTDAENAAHIDALNVAFLVARDEISTLVRRALSPEPITASDLPEFLRMQWVGNDGEWLLRVYPTVDTEGRSILHPDRLGAFVNSISQVDAEVLGPPVQIYESSRLIVRSYIQAAIYAILAILVLLLLDFRSFADSVCSMVPVGIGFIGAFGLMGSFGVPLNFANIIVMPMIFGIGVDAGVHMVHRWRVEPQGRPAGLSGATGRGITLTMITTMIGFGSMMIAEHQGIRSLGMVMVAGLGVTLLACYTVLPAMLRLRTPERPNAET